MNNDIKCPFCGIGEFDLTGLKEHLESRDCEEYSEIDISGIHRLIF